MENGRRRGCASPAGVNPGRVRAGSEGRVEFESRGDVEPVSKGVRRWSCPVLSCRMGWRGKTRCWRWSLTAAARALCAVRAVPLAVVNSGRPVLVLVAQGRTEAEAEAERGFVRRRNG